MSAGKTIKSGGKQLPPVSDLAELLSHALAMENEAVDRYSELAGIMDAHNNYPIVEIFMEMSEIEKLHVDQIKDLMKKHRITSPALKSYHWLSPEAPESTDLADLHYLMTPNQALQLALFNEQRACEYYKAVAANTGDERVRALASKLAEEEEEHVAQVRVWLDDYPDMNDDWDYDDDPPVIQD